MNELAKSISQLKAREDFFRFDQFIIQKMLDMNLEADEINEELRHKAYLECLSRMGKNRVAAVQTIQKWFGIHGYTTPSREKIFHLGYVLCLSAAEVREYFTRGLRQQDFQVNDYREVILVYGLENAFQYEDALVMIREYEGSLPVDVMLVQHNETNEMMQEYELNCHLPREEFMNWMLDRCEYFKGYSKTVLDYFSLYKKEILTYVKEDAGRELESLLKQTNYNEWVKKNKLRGRRKSKTIAQYIQAERRKSNREIPEYMEKSLMEMAEMASISIDSNTELLAELYASVNDQIRSYKTNNKRDVTKRRLPLEINFMNDKYLSNLINVSIHKERHQMLTIIDRELETYSTRKQYCPKPLCDALRQMGYKAKRVLVGTAKEWVKKKRKEESRRCYIMDRNDLLPLIMCVSQKRYLKEKDDLTDIDGEEAGRQFVELANATLSACHMELFQPERYELDAVLMQCFQKDELYFLYEVLEELAV